ncbi:MAG TPA: hypothetical protein VKU01_25110 [Bryobacteraceae bacterium]|nr:hypothetical protein [Bryobacteraceae bacterium]
MTNQPTYDDANLLLRLYELRREDKLRAAREWFMQGLKTPAKVEDLMAQCPQGSENNARYRMVTSYWDMVASFIACGVLNQELALENSGELLFVWTKIKDVVPAVREFFKNPKYLANLEKVANVAIERINQGNPEAYATFAERIVKGLETAGTAKAGVQS